MAVNVSDAVKSAMNSTIGIYARESVNGAAKQNPNSMIGTVASVLVAVKYSTILIITVYVLNAA
jgi:hypothetical protein